MPAYFNLDAEGALSEVLLLRLEPSTAPYTYEAGTVDQVEHEEMLNESYLRHLPDTKVLWD